jgi:predicted transcriptional regulator
LNNQTLNHPKAYNFLYAWQLIPEKCDYQYGAPPKSSIYKMEGSDNSPYLTVSLSWLTHDNQSFQTAYRLIPDGQAHPFDHPEVAADIQGEFIGSHTFKVRASTAGKLVWEVTKEIQPNGYMKLTQEGLAEDGSPYTNVQFYHKQLSVLPYASSVSGAVIKPTEEGMIKHKALTAMEEQTNMQLDQIRKQIELLAIQAHAIQKRKELSLMIYEAALKFKPNIGQVYHLYEKNDGSYMLSLVSPDEWGGAGPFKAFVSSVKLLADHTWVEIG